MPTLAELSALSSPVASMEQEKQALSSATLANAKRNPFLSTLAGTLQGTVAGGSATALGNVTGALGLKQASDALYAKGAQLQADAAPYMAPQLDYTTVNDVGSAWDFAKANAAQGVGSMAPMIAGRVVGGPVLGLAAGYLPQHGENVSRIKDDQRLSGMTGGQILGAAAPTAALQTGLDYIVPGGIATKYARQGAAALGTGALGKAGATVGTNMLLEGGAELGQEELGMGMHGLLNPNRDTSGDEHARIQSFLGGAVGGAPMGAIDAAVGYAQDKFDAKPPKPLDISAESDGILKSRKPLHPNMTDTEMGEALTQRDAQESAQAEQLAQRVKAESQSPRAQKLADEFLAGDKSGPAAEAFVREVHRADKTEKWVEKAHSAGAALREQLNKLSGGRLGNAQGLDTGIEYESVNEAQIASAARSVPNAYGNTGTETEESIIDKLMLAYRSSDIKKRAEAQAEAALQIKDVSEPLNKWIDLNFGADFNEGEVVVPPQMLKLSDKLDVFVQTLYNNKVRRGEKVPTPEKLQAVIAKINELESAPKYGVDAQQGEQEFDDSNPFSDQTDSIGTNEMDPNTISQRKVYTGKSTKADVPYLTDSDTRSLSETRDRLRASGVEPKAVGMWQRAKNELATDPAALRVREDAMLEAKAPADFKRLQSIDVNTLDEVGLKAYDQFRENALKNIDKKYLYIEHEQNEAPEATEVRGEQFRNLKKSPWVVSAKGFEGPENGTVWFKKADGTQFATSTHKLIKLGRRGQTATEKFGTIEQKEALLAGISSFLNAQETDGKPALDGQFGFANADGKVEWLDNRKAADKSSEEFSLDSGGGKPSITRMVKGVQLPANLKLYSGELGEAKYGEVSAYQRGKEAEAEARMNEDKPAPIDTTDMRKPGLAESPSMGQDRHDPGKPIKRNEDGTEAIGEPSGSLVTTSMTSKRVPPTDAQLERVAGLIQQLVTKGVPGTVASAGKDAVERLKTIAGMDKDDELWDGFDPKSRGEVKRRAKAALNVLYKDEANTRTSVPSGGNRAESNPAVEKKPAQPSSLALPKPSDALQYLTDKVLESLRKKGYVNPRALRGAQYTTLRDTLGDVKGNVDAVFVYDGGDPFSIITKETIRVGLRSDSVNAETYKKALKQIQKESVDFEEGELTGGLQRLGNAQTPAADKKPTILKIRDAVMRGDFKKVKDWIETLNMGKLSALIPQLEELSKFNNDNPLYKDFSDKQFETFDYQKVDTLLDAAERRVSRLEDADEDARTGNAQSSAEIPGDKTLTEAEQQEVIDAVNKRLGGNIAKFTDKLFGMINGKRVPLSADWGPGSIRIAINALNPMQAGMHEAMHEFFDRLSKEEAGKPMLDKLKKAANSASVVRQLERLLQNHPNALMQIKEGQPDFENERMAYMYQFWQAGALTIGPDTQTIFQKIANFIRQVTKLLSDDQQAELILQAFDDGKFSDATKTSVVAKVMMEDMNARRNMVDKGVALAMGPLGKARELVFTAHSILAESGIKEFKELANMFDVKQGERAHDSKQGMFEARKQMSSQFLNKLKNVLDKLEKKDAEAVLQALFREDGVAPKDMKQYEAYTQIRALYDDLYDYVDEAGVKRLIKSEGARKEWEKIPKRKNYFGVVWDMMGKESEFAADLVKYHQREIMERLKELGYEDYKESAKHMEYATAIAQRLANAHGAEDLSEVESSLGFSPLMTAINERTLDWIKAPEMMKYRSQDLKETMTSAIMQAVKRAEYVRRFGNGAAVIKEKMLDGYTSMLAQKLEKLGVVEARELAQKLTGTYQELFIDIDAQDGAMVKAKKKKPLDLENYGVTQAQVDKIQLDTLKEIKPLQKAVMAMEGTLGHDISQTLREMSNAMIVYQNFRLLSTTLFASMSDPLGIVVRGGEVDDAYQAMQRGFKEVWKRWKADSGTDDATDLAEMIGSVDAGIFAESLGQTYSSMYMSGKTKWLNDQLFKWNGMEAWNRGMRVGATQAAIKFIKKHLTKPNKDSERFLIELFGEYRPELTDGELNYTDPLVQQAIMRWVDGAILSPNAAQRPMWASDPHYGLFFHMKQFTYSYHRTILSRAWNEAVVHGNAGPVLTLIVGYVPIVIAADAAKSIILSGGEEPYWMDKGVGSTLWHGMSRANLAGIPQIGFDSFGRTMSSKEGVIDATLEGALGLAGPTTGWAKDWYDKPVGDQFVRSLPFGNVLSQVGGQGTEPVKKD